MGMVHLATPLSLTSSRQRTAPRASKTPFMLESRQNMTVVPMANPRARSSSSSCLLAVGCSSSTSRSTSRPPATSSSCEWLAMASSMRWKAFLTAGLGWKASQSSWSCSEPTSHR